MRNFKLGIFVVLIAVLSGCQKAQRDEDVVTNTCEDVSLAQTIFSDAYKQIRYAALHAEGISDATSTEVSRYGCEEIKVDTLSNPKTITIDYKYLGCSGMDVERSGRLVASFFGKFPDPESAVDISFSNYFYQDYQASGSLRIIFKNADAEGHPVNTFYLQNGSIDDGISPMTWTASQSWVQTVNTADAATFKISGTSNGVNRKGNVFFAEMMTDNEMSDDCLWVKSGSVKIEILNLSLRIADYGSGDCDAAGTATINGANYPFVIPQ